MHKEIHNLLKIENDKTTIFTNQELKMIDDYIKELEAYKYNMDRDYLRLEKENQSLKKENKILRENAEHNDKVVDKVNWENQKLKKQVDYLRRSIERKEETITELEHERVPNVNEYVEELKKQLEEYKRLDFKYLNDKCNKLENQQKEFIEYMNKTIEELECDDFDDE